MAESSLTLSTARTEIIFRVPDVTGHTDRIDSRINWAMRDVVMQLRLAEFEDTASTTLVESQSDYDVPSDYLTTISLKNTTNPRILVPKNASHYDQYLSTSDGEPKVYMRFGLKFYLYPSPSSDYAGDTLQIRYRSSPSTLSADDAVFPVPDFCEEAVIVGAIYRLHRDLNEVERAKHAWIQYQGILKAVWNMRKQEFSHNPNAGSMGIVPSTPVLR
jgi:hypothetical protein